MKPTSLKKAIEGVTKGELIVYPTDTLYGLGADIFNASAVKKVYQVKKRPWDNPLPIMVSDRAMMEKIAYISPQAKRLIKKFLPGPLTIIVKKKNIVPDIIAKEKIAIRIPKNNLALNLASSCGPLTATSANIHGGDDPITIDIAKKQIKKKAYIYLDQGPLRGIPSTIVEPLNNTLKIHREGSIKKEELYE